MSIERVGNTIKPQIVPADCKRPLTYGLRGEGLSEIIRIRPAERHTNGAREARRAQQF